MGRLETEASMNKKLTGTESHHERELAELHADRIFAVEYLKAVGMKLSVEPENHAAA